MADSLGLREPIPQPVGRANPQPDWQLSDGLDVQRFYGMTSALAMLGAVRLRDLPSQLGICFCFFYAIVLVVYFSFKSQVLLLRNCLIFCTYSISAVGGTMRLQSEALCLESW